MQEAAMAGFKGQGRHMSVYLHWQDKRPGSPKQGISDVPTWEDGGIPTLVSRTLHIVGS